MKTFRKMVTGANWKIYKKSCSEVIDFIKVLKNNLKEYRTDLIEVYILPDPVSLKPMIDTLGSFPISYGTQDIFWKESGPYTGEISPMILKDIGCRFVFIGHSERKNLFGETDVVINKKVLACYKNGLLPILLVGETIEERNKFKTKEVLERQLSIGLKDIPGSFLSKMALVYEPVWAIGQKQSASIDIIDNSHRLIRNIISNIYNSKIASTVRILYGGSVNTENGREIIRVPDVDGLAITRGSLDPSNFIKFIKMTEIEAIFRYKQSLEGEKK